jgi:tape measure domain-containing protein
MPDNKVEIVIKAVDDASSSLKKVASNLKEVGVSSLKGMSDSATAVKQFQTAFDDLKKSIGKMSSGGFENKFKDLNSELLKTKNTLTSLAKGANIDISKIMPSFNEYSRLMLEPARQAMKEANEDLINQTTVTNAKILGDKKARAEAEYKIVVTALARERDAKIKALALDGNDLRTTIKVNDWYKSQMALAEKNKQDTIISSASISNIKKAEGAFTSLKNSVKTAGSQLKSFAITFSAQMAAMVSTQLISSAFRNVIDQIKDTFINFNDEMTRNKISMETMFGGSSEAATAFLNDLDKFNEKTPFEFPEIADLSKQLLNAGWAAKEVIPDMRALGDAVAASGRGAYALDHIVLALTQIKRLGRLEYQDLKQLSQFIPATQILADELKLKGNQISRISELKISSEKAIDALMQGIEKRYGGLTERLNNTLAVQFSTLKDNFRIIVSEISQPFYNQLVEMLKGVNSWASEIKSTIKDKGIKEAFEELIPSEFKARIEETYNSIYDLGESLADMALELTGAETASDAFLVAIDLATAGIRTATDVAKIYYDVIAGLATKLGEFYAIAENGGIQAIDVSSDASWIAWAAGWDKAAKTNSKHVAELKEKMKNSSNLWFEFKDKSGNKVIQNDKTLSNNYATPTTDIKFPDISETNIKFPGIQVDLSFTRDNLKKGVEGLKNLYNDASKEIYRVVKPSINHFQVLLSSYSEPTKPKKGEKNSDKYSMFSGSSIPPGDSGGGRSEDKIFKLTNHIQDAFNDLNQKIVAETGSSYQLGMSKINDEIDKMQRELVAKGKMKGLDTSALEAKIGEYQNIMSEPIKRAWRDAWTGMRNDTNLAMAKMRDDKKAQAEAEFQIAIAGIEKEKQARLKALGTGDPVTDMQAEIAARNEANLKMAEARKKADEDIRQAEIEKYNMRIEYNQLELDLNLKTQEEIDRLNRKELENKKKYLQEQLGDEKKSFTERLELRRQLAETEKNIQNTPLSGLEGFMSGLKQTSDSFGTWARNMQEVGRQTAASMQAAFQEFFFDAMTGQLKDLGDYIKSFLQGIARAISSALANAFSQKIISSLLGGGKSESSSGGGWLSAITSLFGFRAEGGPVYAGSPYIVGERGPEVFMPRQSGMIIPNHALTGGGQGAAPIVNVYNNTVAEKTEVRQETKWDGKQWVVNVVLEAIANNTGNMRDMLASKGGAY